MFRQETVYDEPDSNCIRRSNCGKKYSDFLTRTRSGKHCTCIQQYRGYEIHNDNQCKRQLCICWSNQIHPSQSCKHAGHVGAEKQHGQISQPQGTGRSQQTGRRTVCVLNAWIQRNIATDIIPHFRQWIGQGIVETASENGIQDQITRVQPKGDHNRNKTLFFSQTIPVTSAWGKQQLQPQHATGDTSAEGSCQQNPRGEKRPGFASTTHQEFKPTDQAKHGKFMWTAGGKCSFIGTA